MKIRISRRKIVLPIRHEREEHEDKSAKSVVMAVQDEHDEGRIQ